MSDHVHKFGLITDGPDCDECEYSATLGLAYCKCGETIGPTEIERRLDATERLNGGMARALAITVLPEKLRPTAMEQHYHNELLAYAAALEGEDEKP